MKPSAERSSASAWSTDRDDGLAIADYPDTVAASAVQTAINKTGAFKSVDVHELLTRQQLTERLVLARDAAQVYQVPGQPSEVRAADACPSGQWSVLNQSNVGWMLEDFPLGAPRKGLGPEAIRGLI